MRLFLAPLLALAACADTSSDPPPACAEVVNADGVCDPANTCDVPDIDCFEVYTTDDAALPAFGRDGQPGLPATDPTVARARMLVDRAWAMLGDELRLGAVGDERVAVVVIPHGGLAEIEASYTDKLPLALALPADLFTLTDDQIVGELLHELVHLARMDRLRPDERAFYTGSNSDDRVATLGKDWIHSASLVGPHSDVELDGMPTRDVSGELGGVLEDVLLPECGMAQAELAELQRQMVFAAVTGRYVPSDSDHQLLQAFELEIEQCQAGSLHDLLPALPPAVAADIKGDLGDDAMTLLDMPAQQAIYWLIANRRRDMRETEAALRSFTGASWQTLRYRSRADIADELALKIGREHGLTGDGLGGVLRARLGAAAELDACDAAIAGDAVPYGINLADDHHGLCWRLERAEEMQP